MVIFARPTVGLFIPNAGALQDLAVLGVRLFAGGLILRCINNPLKNAYQAMDKVHLTEIISIVQCAVFPILSAFLLSRFLGTTGVWFFFVMGELLTVAALGLYVKKVMKTEPWKDYSFLLLKDDFSVPEDHILEIDVRTIEDVTKAANAAEDFCRRHGQDARITNHIALCIEEMASNTIQHGFSRSGKQNHLFIRVLYKEDAFVLRFRDDCGAFDPVNYIPREGKDALGIRLVMAVAQDAQYTHSLNLNNLMLKVPIE